MVNGERIKELMIKKGISNKDMAGRIGVTEAMMSYILNGLREPNVRSLVRIACELEVSVDDLIVKER